MAEQLQDNEISDQTSQLVDSNDEDSRLMSMLIYLLSLFSGIIGPIIIWVIKRKESKLVDKAGKNYFNFAISYTIWTIILTVIMLIPFIIGLSMNNDTAAMIGIIFYIVGAFALLVLCLLSFIFTIIACVKYYGGKEYLIPLSIRFFK